MNLSHKQINAIKKQYPQKSAQQIADELHMPLSTVYRALGLKNELWSLWIETAAGILAVILLLVSPLIFMRDLYDFADLPQRVVIQTIAAVLALLWAVGALIKGEVAIPRTALLGVIGGLIVWSFVTVLWTADVYEGFYSAMHLAMCGVAFFTISAVLHNSKWIKWMLSASIISAVLVSIIGLAQQYLQFKFITQSEPTAATLGNPNMAADYLVIVLPFVIAIGVAQKKMLYRCLLLTALILSLIYLYNTHSRGDWLAIFCAALSMGLLYTMNKYNSSNIKRGLIVAVILFACLMPAILFTKSGNRILNAALSEYRLIAWRNSIGMIWDKPVQGVGSGNFKIIYPAYSHWAVVDRVLDKTHYLGKAHNDYIQIAAELGIPGFLLFVLVPTYGLVLSWRLLREPRNCSFYPVIVGVAGGLIAFMVSAFFSFPMQRSLPPLLVFFYCGILAILNGDPAGQNKKMIIKLARPIGLILVFLIGFSGVALLRFNLRNINCDKYYFKAIGMEKSGVDRKALSVSLNAHQYNKHRMDVLTTMGRAYIATGELNRATETLEKVISKTPNNLNALFFLGVAYTNNDRNAKALEIFKRVLHLYPDFYLARQIICSLKAFGKARVSLS